ncbi:HupE/UreJ family protein [Henriciella pelagia]|jgi:hydrogenase/urease accessory protein HupE|uniref:Membrane protein n=1 Tax=Henriciella pelagia TaxID=1977912 RepID=A0ABQ1JFF7_9PROT|nr:HupE/UreJ family protein [Henriciella pelagia]GGB64962.1 membrane protein [Henriciella pelagia]
MKVLRLALLIVLGGLFSAMASAHELRSGYLEVVQVEETPQFDIVWKAPVLAGLALDVEPVFPQDCKVDPVAAQRNAAGDILTVSRAVCAAPLVGRSLTFRGLEQTDGDVLIRIGALSGTTLSQRVTSHDPAVDWGRGASGSLFPTYFVLGVEHILIGLDHLLFLACLVLLIQRMQKLVVAITFFTIAHSLTLVATTFGWIGLSIAPVEATIALSIVFLASEILQARSGRQTLTQKYPWVVTFTFGLLHGLGFASVLSEIGLPGEAVPLALLAFNLGVEAGQLLFVGGTVLAVMVMNRVRLFQPARLVATYCIGSMATFWVIERML